MSNGLLEIKKDKRLLVLFAFGLSLLLFDFLLPLWQQVRAGDTARVSSTANLIALAEKEDLSPREAFFLNQPMSINRASVQELCLLPGIGVRLAEQIVEFRERNGLLGNPSDLEKISGIGKKTSQMISAYVTFREP